MATSYPDIGAIQQPPAGNGTGGQSYVDLGAIQTVADPPVVPAAIIFKHA